MPSSTLASLLYVADSYKSLILLVALRVTHFAGGYSQDLIELLEKYMEFVSVRGEKHAAKLDKCAEPLTEKFLALFAQAKGAATAANLTAQIRVLSATADYLSRSDADPLDGLFRMLYVGMIEGAKNQNEINRIRAAFESDWLGYLLREGMPEYLRKAKPFRDAFLKDVRADLAMRRKKVRSLVKCMVCLEDPVVTKEWPPDETPFLSGSEVTESRNNLFSLVRHLDERAITTDKGPSKEAAERLARARRYWIMTSYIPKQDDKAFYYYRAVECLAKAGMEANRAAALTAGAQGFSARKINEAPKLAFDAWSWFEKFFDRDMTDEILHQYALALAYNGRARDAYDLIKKTKPELRPNTQVFYFDFARICSVAAEDVEANFARLPQRQQQSVLLKKQKQLTMTNMIRDSSWALRRAVLLGFKDFEKAREAPDLKRLRAADARTLGPRYLTFDRIVGSP